MEGVAEATRETFRSLVADGLVLVCNPAARSLLSLSGEVSLESIRGMPRLSPLVALIDQARVPFFPEAGQAAFDKSSYRYL